MSSLLAVFFRIILIRRSKPVHESNLTFHTPVILCETAVGIWGENGDEGPTGQ
jgi:hypothetical protein